MSNLKAQYKIQTEEATTNTLSAYGSRIVDQQGWEQTGTNEPYRYDLEGTSYGTFVNQEDNDAPPWFNDAAIQGTVDRWGEGVDQFIFDSDDLFNFIKLGADNSLTLCAQGELCRFNAHPDVIGGEQYIIRLERNGSEVNMFLGTEEGNLTAHPDNPVEWSENAMLWRNLGANHTRPLYTFDGSAGNYFQLNREMQLIGGSTDSTSLFFTTNGVSYPVSNQWYSILGHDTENNVHISIADVTGIGLEQRIRIGFDGVSRRGQVDFTFAAVDVSQEVEWEVQRNTDNTFTFFANGVNLGTSALSDASDAPVNFNTIGGAPATAANESIVGEVYDIRFTDYLTSEPNLIVIGVDTGEDLITSSDPTLAGMINDNTGTWTFNNNAGIWTYQFIGTTGNEIVFRNEQGLDTPVCNWEQDTSTARSMFFKTRNIDVQNFRAPFNNLLGHSFGNPTLSVANMDNLGVWRMRIGTQGSGNFRAGQVDIPYANIDMQAENQWEIRRETNNSYSFFLNGTFLLNDTFNAFTGAIQFNVIGGHPTDRSSYINGTGSIYEIIVPHFENGEWTTVYIPNDDLQDTVRTTRPNINGQVQGGGSTGGAWTRIENAESFSGALYDLTVGSFHWTMGGGSEYQTSTFYEDNQDSGRDINIQNYDINQWYDVGNASTVTHIEDDMGQGAAFVMIDENDGTAFGRWVYQLDGVNDYILSNARGSAAVEGYMKLELTLHVDSYPNVGELATLVGTELGTDPEIFGVISLNSDGDLVIGSYDNPSPRVLPLTHDWLTGDTLLVLERFADDTGTVSINNQVVFSGNTQDILAIALFNSFGATMDENNVYTNFLHGHFTRFFFDTGTVQYEGNFDSQNANPTFEILTNGVILTGNIEGGYQQSQWVQEDTDGLTPSLSVPFTQNENTNFGTNGGIARLVYRSPNLAPIGLDTSVTSLTWDRRWDGFEPETHLNLNGIDQYITHSPVSLSNGVRQVFQADVSILNDASDGIDFPIWSASTNQAVFGFFTDGSRYTFNVRNFGGYDGDDFGSIQAGEYRVRLEDNDWNDGELNGATVTIWELSDLNNPIFVGTGRTGERAQSMDRVGYCAAQGSQVETYARGWIKNLQWVQNNVIQFDVPMDDGSGTTLKNNGSQPDMTAVNVTDADWYTDPNLFQGIVFTTRQTASGAELVLYADDATGGEKSWDITGYDPNTFFDLSFGYVPSINELEVFVNGVYIPELSGTEFRSTNPEYCFDAAFRTTGGVPERAGTSKHLQLAQILSFNEDEVIELTTDDFLNGRIYSLTGIRPITFITPADTSIPMGSEVTWETDSTLPIDVTIQRPDEFTLVNLSGFPETVENTNRGTIVLANIPDVTDGYVPAFVIGKRS